MVLAERERHAIGLPDNLLPLGEAQERESKLLSPCMKYFPGGTVMESNVRGARRDGSFSAMRQCR